MTFAMVDKKKSLEPDSYTLESAYGSVTPSATPEDFDKIVDAAKDGKAEDTVRELQKG